MPRRHANAGPRYVSEKHGVSPGERLLALEESLKQEASRFLHRKASTTQTARTGLSWLLRTA